MKATQPYDRIERPVEAPEVPDQVKAEAVSPSGLTPQRRAEILERIASGYYDRPEVVEEVARRLAADLDRGMGA